MGKINSKQGKKIENRKHKAQNKTVVQKPQKSVTISKIMNYITAPHESSNGLLTYNIIKMYEHLEVAKSTGEA